MVPADVWRKLPQDLQKLIIQERKKEREAEPNAPRDKDSVKPALRSDDVKPEAKKDPQKFDQCLPR